MIPAMIPRLFHRLFRPLFYDRSVVIPVEYDQEALSGDIFDARNYDTNQKTTTSQSNPSTYHQTSDPSKLRVQVAHNHIISQNPNLMTLDSADPSKLDKKSWHDPYANPYQLLAPQAAWRHQQSKQMDSNLFHETNTPSTPINKQSIYGDDVPYRSYLFNSSLDIKDPSWDERLKYDKEMMSNHMNLRTRNIARQQTPQTKDHEVVDVSYDEAESVMSYHSDDEINRMKRQSTSPSQRTTSSSPSHLAASSSRSKVSPSNHSIGKGNDPYRSSRGQKGLAVIDIHRRNQAKKLDDWLHSLGVNYSFANALSNLPSTSSSSSSRKSPRKGQGSPIAKDVDVSNGVVLCEILMKAYRLSSFPGVDWSPKTTAQKKQNIRKFLEIIKLRCKSIRLSELVIEEDIYNGGIQGYHAVISLLDTLRRSLQVK